MSSYDKDYVCEDFGDVKDWTQIKVTVPTEELDSLTALMSMINNNLMIEDYSDIEINLNTCYGDLIDEKILNANKNIASVSVFVPCDRSYTDDVAFIKQRMSELGLHGEIECDGVCEEDWANSWKQYYKPIKCGERIVICPAWEKYTPADGEIVVNMDPGMAFGTGTHETTRLCIRLLEKYAKAGDLMVDVGTGTGILAICASRLGAKFCRAYDIDPMAVRVARENIADSGLDNVTCDTSDLLHHVSLEDGKYDVMCANIVADIIIRMTPDVSTYLKDDGILLASGIILSRCDDVVEAFDKCGYELVEKIIDNDWCGLAIKKKR